MKHTPWTIAVITAFVLLFSGITASFVMAAPSSDLSIENLVLVSQKRIGRRTFEFTFSADVINASSDNGYEAVSAVLTSAGTGTVILDDSLAFPDVGAGENQGVTDTFQIRQDRRFVFNPADLVWDISATAVPVDPDADEDGYPASVDCDDTDPDIHPGAVEVLNGKDDDCDGDVDEGKATYYRDADDDTYGDPNDSMEAIGQPEGYVLDNTDCDDTDPSINPGATEIPLNGIDDDCDPGTSDEVEVSFSGLVTGGGALLGGVNLTIGTNSLTGTTSGSGQFAISGALDHTQTITVAGARIFPIIAEKDGYTPGFMKVPWVNGVFVYSDIEITLLPITAMIGEDDDLTAGVNIVRSKDGGTEEIGSLRIPAESLPSNTPLPVTGTITYIDPTTTDINGIPGGDLLALPAGSNPNDPGAIVPLEPLGMMKFDLKDADGNPVTELLGDATLCMKVPAGISAADGEVIELWHYDEDQGLWIEDGSGIVETRADGLWMCGGVSHFTWWNYDRPVTSHSCFKFQALDLATGLPISYTNAYAKGVTYSGVSPARLCACDGDDPAPCPGSNMSSFTVKRTENPSSPEQIRVYVVISGQHYFLADHATIPGAYRLTQTEADARVFNTPELQGSCLQNSNVQNCELLAAANPTDPDPGDGEILVDTVNINFAPVIINLSIPDEVDGDTVITVTADINDLNPGDTVTVTWSATCGIINDLVNINNQPPPQTAQAEFTAPMSLSYCRITVTATDNHGASSQAYKYILIRGESNTTTIEGTVYGPGGAPASGVEVRLYGYDSSEQEWTAITEADGSYAIAGVPCCISYGDGYVGSFDGNLSVSLMVGDTLWTLDKFIYLSCCDDYGNGGLAAAKKPLSRRLNDLAVAADTLITPAAQAAIVETGCSYDMHFPVFWGTVEGTYIPSGSDPVEASEIFLDYWGLFDDTYLYAQAVLGSDGSYGPISVPVGGETELYFGSLGFGGEVHLLHEGQELIRDLGPGAMADVTGVVYDNNGDPTPIPLPVELTTWGLPDQLTVTSLVDPPGLGTYTFTGLPAHPDSLWDNWDLTVPEGAGLESNQNRFQVEVNGSTIVRDINGPDCTVQGRLVDVMGAPV